jgi:PAS domain S-box-containing protein
VGKSEKNEAITIPVDNLNKKEQELIFNNAVDLTFLVRVEEDGRFQFVTVNNAFLNAARLRRDQVEGKYVEDVIPPSLYPAIFARYKQAIHEGQTIQWEDTSDYPDGRRTGIISITPIFNEKGTCTLLVGMLHDITERKKAEEKLRSSETQLDLIYNTVSDVIFLLSIEPGPRYRFSSVNNAFLNITGLKKEQVEGKYVDEIIPEPSLTYVLDNYRKAIHDRCKIQWEEISEYPAGSKTGIVTITPVFNDQDECSMLVGVVHDITEQKKAQEEKDKVTYLLNERVKELTTVYRADQILKSDDKPLNEILQELVSVLPSGWQYPGITEAMISIGDQQFATSGFGSRVYSKSAKFSTSEGRTGLIEVAYTKETTAEAEGPFFTEEHNMINLLAEMLRVFFERKGAATRLLKEKKLSDKIIETLPGLFYMIDTNGKYIRWNKLKETMSGYTHEEMSKMNSIDFFAGDDKDKILQAITNGFKTGHTEVEAHVITKDKKKILYYFTGVVIDYEGKPCLMGMGIDIAERKKATEQLQKEKELSESIINSLPGIFYLFDSAGQYLLWNKNHETVPEYNTDEMKKMHPLNFFDDDDKQIVRERIEKVFTEGYAEVEAYFKTKSGRKIPYYFNGIAINYDNKPCLMGVGIDITEKKILEHEIMDQKVQEQKKMTRAVLNGQEKERNKIAQELHDNVNQILAGAKMYLGYINKKGVDIQEGIKESIRLIDNAITEIRSLTQEQITPQRKIDLQHLVQSLLDNMNEHSSIQTEFVYDIGSFKIKDDLKINIYRIIQESLNNILKHAAAKNVSLLIKADHVALQLSIADDGNGFDTSAIVTRGVGISNIHSRVESYNGKISIESKPANGCIIDITIPL